MKSGCFLKMTERKNFFSYEGGGKELRIKVGNNHKEFTFGATHICNISYLMPSYHKNSIIKFYRIEMFHRERGILKFLYNNNNVKYL